MQLLDNVKKICGLTDDQQLAEMLGKDKSTVSKWRSNGIPAKAERELKKILAEKQGTAEPETPYTPAQIEPQTKKAERNPIVEALLGATDKLSPAGQAEMLEIAIKKLISEQTKEKE